MAEDNRYCIHCKKVTDESGQKFFRHEVGILCKQCREFYQRWQEMSDAERWEHSLEECKWLRDNRIETANPQEEACLLLLHASNKHTVELWRLSGCSYESAFWIDFVAMSLCSWRWRQKGGFDIRLSKLLEMYLKTYSENMRLNNEEQSAFLNVLKNKHYEVDRVVYRFNGEAAARGLLRLIHREGETIVLSVLATGWVVDFVNAVSNDLAEMKWKLVEDV